MDQYATGQALKNIGVISGYDMTIEAALTKLQFLFGQPNYTIDEVKKKMKECLVGELTPPTLKTRELTELPPSDTITPTSSFSLSLKSPAATPTAFLLGSSPPKVPSLAVSSLLPTSPPSSLLPFLSSNPLMINASTSPHNKALAEASLSSLCSPPQHVPAVEAFPFQYHSSFGYFRPDLSPLLRRNRTLDRHQHTAPE